MDLDTVEKLIWGFVATVVAVLGWALVFINTRAHAKIDSNSSKQEAMQLSIASISTQVAVIAATTQDTRTTLAKLEEHAREDLAELDRRVRSVEATSGYCHVPDKRKKKGSPNDESSD